MALNNNSIAGWCRFNATSLVFSLLLALTGCGGSENDLQTYTDQLKQTKPKSVKPPEDAISIIPKAVTFKAGALRSPFDGVRSVSMPKAAVMANPLLGYPLNMLRFIGTMTQKNIDYAFILTPDNVVYQVKKGDSIGDREGEVLVVKENQLDISERVPQTGSAAGSRVVTLKLKEEH